MLVQTFIFNHLLTRYLKSPDFLWYCAVNWILDMLSIWHFIKWLCNILSMVCNTTRKLLKDYLKNINHVCLLHWTGSAKQANLDILGPCRAVAGCSFYCLTFYKTVVTFITVKGNPTWAPQLRKEADLAGFLLCYKNYEIVVSILIWTKPELSPGLRS